MGTVGVMENRFVDSFRAFLYRASVPYEEEGSLFLFPQHAFAVLPVEKDKVSPDIVFSGQEYDLLYLYEDRWYGCRSVTEARILARLGRFRHIFARKCRIICSSDPQASRNAGAFAQFLEKYHAYGDAKSKYRYGLLYDGELVAVATFSAARPMVRRILEPYKNVPPEEVASLRFAVDFLPGQTAYSYRDAVTVESYEWIRYASLPDVRVAGAMGRLLRAFLKEVTQKNAPAGNRLPVEVMTYADKEWSGGAVYEKLGFVPSGERPPVEYYVEKETYRRFSARKLRAYYNLSQTEKIAATGMLPRSFLDRFYIISNRGSRKFLLRPGK